MFKQISTLRSKLSVLMALLDHITVHKDYIEITLPENVVITGENHMVIRTKGKLMLNPRIPKGRTLEEHSRVIDQQKLLEKK